MLREPVTVTIKVGLDWHWPAGSRWYNGNGWCVVMVMALVWILTAVCFFYLFSSQNYTSLILFLVLRVLGLGSKLQEGRPMIPPRGSGGAKPPSLVHSLA